jgi:hypothetical protein
VFGCDQQVAPDPEPVLPDAGTPGLDRDRCFLPDGTCVEHCTPLAGGHCLDPCFVDTTECSPDCVQPDGSCGWPPTK